MPNLRNGSKGGFEPGLSRLRVRHVILCLCRLQTTIIDQFHYTTFILYAQFVDMNSGRESTLFGQNTIHDFCYKFREILGHFRETWISGVISGDSRKFRETWQVCMISTTVYSQVLIQLSQQGRE